MTQKEKNIFRLSRAITNSLRGVASEKERGTLEQWLAASKKNREIYEGFKQGSYLEQKLSDYNAVNRLGDYERFITTRRKRTRFSIKTFVRYAAILILPLGLALVLLLREKQPEPVIAISEVITPGSHKAILTMGGGERIVLSDSTFTPLQEQNGMIVKIQNSKVSYLTPTDTLISETTPIYNTLQVPRGGEYNLKLADGTNVWMFAESEIRFPTRFEGNKREVYLSGEAYFEVHHDPVHPFYVKTKSLDVKVLGTSFNINAYPEEEWVKTTLVEGSVKTLCGNHNFIMKPNTQVAYNRKTQKVEYFPVNIQQYTSWKDGYYDFEDMPLKVLMQIFSRWYNIKLEFAKPELKELKFSGRLKRYDDLHSLFKMLEYTRDIKFIIGKDKIIIQSK